LLQKWLLLCAGLLAWVLTTVGQAQATPAGTSVIADDPIKAFALVGSEANLGKLEVIDIPGQPFNQAFRIFTLSAPTTEWNIQLRAPTASPVKPGEVLMALHGFCGDYQVNASLAAKNKSMQVHLTRQGSKLKLILEL
jgi:hypothetical protein